jgi:hypothetical protein|nr:MAG TPA: hypothetical protein [Caudoviricetes sp.]DAS42073.1 MAG TPA: hypothetical protein [Caudoviricetes sp.]DAU32840.1 MAG TPA: hypothetical protein [Bacteriophage sp.]DAX55660.1 MAG TPA: hypothetical protein [Caudoviricetes sp.]
MPLNLRTLNVDTPIATIVPVVNHNNKELEALHERVFKEDEDGIAVKIGISTDKDIKANKGVFDSIEARTLSIEEDSALVSSLAEYVRTTLLAPIQNEMREKNEVYTASITSINALSLKMEKAEQNADEALRIAKSNREEAEEIKKILQAVLSDINTIKEYLKL